MCPSLVEFSVHLKETAIYCHSNKHDDKQFIHFYFHSITTIAVDCDFCSSILYVISKSSKLFC